MARVSAYRAYTTPVCPDGCCLSGTDRKLITQMPDSACVRPMYQIFDDGYINSRGSFTWSPDSRYCDYCWLTGGYTQCQRICAVRQTCNPEEETP